MPKGPLPRAVKVDLESPLCCYFTVNRTRHHADGRIEVSRQPAWLKRMKGTAGNCSRGPNRLLRAAALGPALSASLSAPPCSAVLCRGSLDALPGSAGRRRCSLTCPIKAASLPFLNENGTREGQVEGIINPYNGRFGRTICAKGEPSIDSLPKHFDKFFPGTVWALFFWRQRASGREGWWRMSRIIDSASRLSLFHLLVRQWTWELGENGVLDESLSFFCWKGWNGSENFVENKASQGKEASIRRTGEGESIRKIRSFAQDLCGL